MEKIHVNVPDHTLEISEMMIEVYLQSLSDQGKSEATIGVYRRNLFRLCRLLPDDKRIHRQTLKRLRTHMLKNGYAASTVNTFTVSVNGFLEFYGCREYQVFDTLKCEKEEQPEITRAEYLSLLSVAKLQGRERTYFLVKVIASTGVMLSQLPEITTEAVRTGQLCLQGKTIQIPSALSRELLDYADRHKIQAGAIFVTRTGHKVDRSNINREIRNLASEAGVEPEKCTALSLRKLYQTTQENIRSRIEMLVQQDAERLIEQEQSRYGWEQVECVQG